MDHDNPWATDDGDDGDDDDDDWPDADYSLQADRAVHLDTILHHCQQVSQEIWPSPETSNDGNWRSGFDNLADITALLAQLLPIDQTLPPTVQFSATATAIAMNEALKQTRHLPASASSPLSRLLASKGSLEWEKSIKAKQDMVPDTAHVGWRVLEKDDRLTTVEESKPRKAPGGLLSFWNRRASAIQAAPAETPTERSNSPARSSLESAQSVHRPPSSRAPSPTKPPTPSVPPPPPPDSYPAAVATTAVPSAVSRFLNRFSRAKGAQHSALALSSDDLEFLSDIVPSASDPPDENLVNSAFGASAGASSPSSLPPKLPPPIPPPPKQPMPPNSSSPSLADGARVTGSALTASQVQGANQTPNVAILAPPLSPKPAGFFSRTQSPSVSPKDVASLSVAFGQTSTPSTHQKPQSSSHPHPLTLSPRQKVSPLSIPPLLPPPPVSPPQTPRPNAFSITAPGHSSTLQSSDVSSFRDPYESDEEFTAFTSFPPSAPAPFPSLESRPPPRSPSPPSPPPRRTYERTHYPSSSSTSSILSPASQSSADQLCSMKSSISASLDSFDDFVSPPSVVRGDNRKHTPSPPPLPAKSQSQHWQLPRIDISTPPVHHGHTLSQTFASPTAHTSLMTSMFPVSSVSDTEHQRTQALVDHAAARGGSVWPNSPELEEPRVQVIPPPLPPPFALPKSSVGEECFDLLGDGDTLGGGRLETPPAPVRLAGSIGVGALHALAGGPGKGLGLSNQLQPSSPPSAPLPSFSSFGTSAPSAATNTGSVQPAQPRQTGGLSAQDLSFFEGL